MARSFWQNNLLIKQIDPTDKTMTEFIARLDDATKYLGSYHSAMKVRDAIERWTLQWCEEEDNEALTEEQTEEFEFWMDEYHEMMEEAEPDVILLIRDIQKSSYMYNPEREVLGHKGFKRLINIMKEKANGN